jgi:putative heme-binding domain-containing protein
MRHRHGSTALCGLAIEDGLAFPREFAGDIFVGDVLASRIHRDALEWRGSTPHLAARPDLVVSADPWFRPVDLVIGPDGALYVADFYNRIIGHYEVPLDHPGRDRTSGRIWRIAPRGAVARPLRLELRTRTAEQLVGAFFDRNATVRRLALDELTDRCRRDEALAAVDAALRSAPPWDDDHAAGLLLMARLRLAPEAFQNPLPIPVPAGAKPQARIAALRLLASAAPEGSAAPAIAAALRDPDPFVRRAAAAELSRRPQLEAIGPSLLAWRQAPGDDALLRHSLRIALRAQLALPGAFRVLEEIARTTPELGPADAGVRDELLQIAATIAAPEAPQFALRHSVDRLTRLQLLEAHVSAQERSGGPISPEAWRLAEQLVPAVLEEALREVEARAVWCNCPADGVPRSPDPWRLEARRCTDGVTATFLSSLPGGEALTGVLRSPPFQAPERLGVWIAGHDGPPDQAPQSANRVRVVTVEGERTIAEQTVPRHDVAHRREFDLSAAAGARVVLEVVDGDAGGAYAWLAVGRLDDGVVAMPGADPSRSGGERQLALSLAGLLRGRDMGEPPLDAPLSALLLDPAFDPKTRAAAARAKLAPHEGRLPATARALASLVGEPALPSAARDAIAHGLASACDAAASDAVKAGRSLAELASSVLEPAAARLQLPLATALAGDAAGAGRLLDQVAAGRAPAALLLEPQLAEALSASLPEVAPTRIEQLTRGLKTRDERRPELLAKRRAALAQRGGDPLAGATQFERHCASCHAIGGRGATIGPQLDGVGRRGVERLLEDLFDPDRNVDPAFARTTLVLANGDLRSVLVRRRDPESLLVVDEQGREERIARAAVVRERPSSRSLMPGNLDETLDETATRDLLAWLLSGAR